jgi:hypothetical protein
MIKVAACVQVVGLLGRHVIDRIDPGMGQQRPRLTTTRGRASSFAVHAKATRPLTGLVNNKLKTPMA